MQFTWSAPDQVDLPFLVGKRQVVGNFLARRAQKIFWGVNLRCRKDFACFLGKKCRICPSFQENMQDLANFLGRNVGFVGNFVARRAKKFFGGKYALQEGFCSRKGNQDQQENFKIAIQTYHPWYRPGVVVEVAVLARQCPRPRVGGDCHHAQLCVIVYRVLREIYLK